MTIHKMKPVDVRWIKIKPVDVKSSKYIDCSKDDNENNPKFKIGDIVKMSKY